MNETSEVSCSECAIFQMIRKDFSACVEFRWAMEIGDGPGVVFQEYTALCWHPVGTIKVVDERPET